MRKMLLSFKPEYMRNKIKKKNLNIEETLPDEPIMAYMYVSAPIKAIKGIVYLGKRHLLSDWREEFKMIKRLLFVLRSIKNYIDTLWKSMNFKKLQKFHLAL